MPPHPVQALYLDHHRWLQGWLHRRLGNAFDAADLAHDAYVRLMKREVRVLREIREPRALLTTIAQGLVLNLHRRRRVEQAWIDTLAALPEPLAPSPEQCALVLEVLVEIDRRLGRLPGPVRETFLLSQLEGMKQADIAARLGLSVPTVKRHIARAVMQVCLATDEGP